MVVRAKGRPQSRWRDEAVDDLKKLKLRNWSQIVNDRKACNYLAQKTKFQTLCRVVVSEEGEGEEAEDADAGHGGGEE
jgi:hypothetical protein